MFYNLHFNELNAPYGDDTLVHDILITTDKEIDIHSIFKEIDNYKEQMDFEDGGYDYSDYNYEDHNIPANPLFEEYSDYGWHEKINEALNIVISNHPELDIKVIDVKNCEYSIN